MKPCLLEERQIAIILAQVVLALSSLHASNKIHRDIKSANILLNEFGQVKLADFGVSAKVSATVGRNTFVGTPYWMGKKIQIKQFTIYIISSRNNLAKCLRFKSRCLVTWYHGI